MDVCMRTSKRFDGGVWREIASCRVLFEKLLIDMMPRRSDGLWFGSLGDMASTRVRITLQALRSNGFRGAVNGLNNRIKLVKRMMYDRAQLPLLRTRVLHR